MNEKPTEQAHKLGQEEFSFVGKKLEEKKLIYQHTLSCCLYKCRYLLVLKENQEMI